MLWVWLKEEKKKEKKMLQLIFVLNLSKHQSTKILSTAPQRTTEKETIIQPKGGRKGTKNGNRKPKMVAE